MIASKLLLLLLLACSSFYTAVYGKAASLSVHFITFNVKDNTLMPGGEIPKTVAAKLLHLEGENAQAGFKDVYVVGLQENCYKCNKDNMPQVAKIFLDQLNEYAKKNQKPTYDFVGLSSTRSSSSCEMLACNSLASQHGTSITMVFAKSGLTKSFTARKRNRCTTGVSILRNSEKGLAGIKLITKDDKKLCFISGHLDAGEVTGRQACFEEFFGANGGAADKDDDDASDAQTSPNWHKDCDSIFIAGDFNTRTAPKDIPNGVKVGKLATAATFKELLDLDELSGSKPYSGRSLLQAIRDITKLSFQEAMRPIVDVPSFVATYSMLTKDKCNNQVPCYSGKRPISWTDRIVCYNCGKVTHYSPMLSLHDVSDHLPVVGIFENV